MNKTEEYLIGLMREVCEELGLPEEKGERCPILEALNQAYNRGRSTVELADLEFDAAQADSLATLYREKLSALSRIVRRALACGQLEKLEDARRYLDDDAGELTPAQPVPLQSHAEIALRRAGEVMPGCEGTTHEWRAGYAQALFDSSAQEAGARRSAEQ